MRASRTIPWTQAVLRTFLLIVACAGLVPSPGARPAGARFMVRLQLTHGHLRECWFGVAPGGTDGFDRKLDEMAPPPGIETGYTAFVSPDGKFFFYKDVRGPGDRHVWKFMARVFPGKPIHIRWDPAALPAGYRFTLRNGSQSVDMRRQNAVTVEQTRILTIEVVRREQTPAKSDQ